MLTVVGRCALKELKAKLQAIGKSQASIEFDLNGVILDANENFLNAVGYRLDEIKGQHHRMFVEPEHGRSVEYAQFWENLRGGQYQAGEYKRFGKGGREIWIQASYNPLLDSRNKPFKVVKFATDITRQKLNSADHEGQLDAIGKSQAVIEFNLDGTIIKANKNFLNAVGYELGEIKGQHHRMFVDPAYGRSDEYRLFWDTLRRGEFQAAEYRRIGKGGREIWIQATYNPIFDPSGRPFKVVKFATDITAQMNRRLNNERLGLVVDEKFGAIVAALDGVNQQTTTAATSASQTSASVQTVAAGAEELSSSIREISSSILMSKKAVDQAMLQVDEADQNTAKLSQGAAAMNSIITFIQDIASNINLLALNATIESARAGEAGKGFAVVASEVKNLASQVAQATEKISVEITSMQSVSGDVVQALNAIKSSIGAVQSSVTGVAGAVEEQTAVTNEISSNMQTTASAVTSIEGSLREIMKAAEVISIDSQQLHGQIKSSAA